MASMENHAGRQEVQEALHHGSGESSRYSDTLLQQTLYVARRLTDGTVLRISVSRATAGMLALGMLQPMLVVLAAALMIYALIWGDEAASRTFRPPFSGRWWCALWAFTVWPRATPFSPAPTICTPSSLPARRGTSSPVA